MGVMLKHIHRVSHLNRLQPRFAKVRFNASVAEIEREKMFYDVVTVGGGPAGLSAAIRMKQLAAEKGVDLSVCVVEKAAEVGSHILSGNVFEPRALDELIPNWRELDAPLETAVSHDRFFWLTKDSHVEVPQILMPKQLHNEGNYIISLSQLTRWLGTKAEELGVEIYPGFSADEIIYDANGAVAGVCLISYLVNFLYLFYKCLILSFAM